MTASVVAAVAAVVTVVGVAEEASIDGVASVVNGLLLLCLLQQCLVH